MEIFCPNRHLILDNTVCPSCGWKRPPDAGLGSLRWPIIELPTGLGGESTSLFGQTITLEDRTIIPLRDQSIVTISNSDGRTLWHNLMTEDLAIGQLINKQGQILMVLFPTNTFTEESSGIWVLNPNSGEKHPVWSDNSPHMAIHLWHDQYLIVRTSKGKLFSLNVNDFSTKNWECQIDGWNFLPVVQYERYVCLLESPGFGNGCTLKLINIDNGEVIKSVKLTESVTHIAASEHGLILQYKRTMTCFDPLKNHSVWENQFNKIYTPFLVNNGKAFVVHRAGTDPKSPGYYQLTALDVNNGKTCWHASLPERVSLPMMIKNELLFVGGESGTILMLSPDDGRELKPAIILGGKGDPIKTRFSANKHGLSAGTHQGKFAQISLQTRDYARINPEELVSMGNLKEAAAAFALQGEFSKSADIYRFKLGQLREAVLLYEKGGLLREAARTALESSWLDKALEIYRELNDFAGEAEVLLAMGDTLGAAQKFEQAQLFGQAAECYEEFGELRLAMDNYKKAGRRDDFKRLRKIVPRGLDDVEELRKMGDYEEAAEIQFKEDEFRGAAEDFQKAGNFQREYESYLKLLELSGPQQIQWLIPRLLDLSVNLDRPDIKALAFGLSGKPKEEAEAYEVAAVKLIRTDPAKRAQISDFLEKAYRLYEKWMRDEANLNDLQEAIRYWRNQPLLRYNLNQGETRFIEYEWNIVVFTVTNLEYGRACNVQLSLVSDRYEIEDPLIFSEPFNLYEGTTQNIRLEIRSQSSQAGERVPLIIAVNYSTEDGTNFSETYRGYLSVRAKQSNMIHGEKIIMGDHKEDKSINISNTPIQPKPTAPAVSLQVSAQTVKKEVLIVCSNPDCARINEDGIKFCMYCGGHLIEKVEE